MTMKKFDTQHKNIQHIVIQHNTTQHDNEKNATPSMNDIQFNNAQDLVYLHYIQHTYINCRNAECHGDNI
jgi:hypothetical protein